MSFSDWTIVVSVGQDDTNNNSSSSKTIPDWNHKDNDNGGPIGPNAYSVHRTALAVGPRRCDYFRTLFLQPACAEQTDRTSRIVLDTVAELQGFETLLDFVYGHVDERQNNNNNCNNGDGAGNDGSFRTDTSNDIDKMNTAGCDSMLVLPKQRRDSSLNFAVLRHIGRYFQCGAFLEAIRIEMQNQSEELDNQWIRLLLDGHSYCDDEMVDMAAAKIAELYDNYTATADFQTIPLTLFPHLFSQGCFYTERRVSGVVRHVLERNGPDDGTNAEERIDVDNDMESSSTGELTPSLLAELTVQNFMPKIAPEDANFFMQQICLHTDPTTGSPPNVLGSLRFRCMEALVGSWMDQDVDSLQLRLDSKDVSQHRFTQEQTLNSLRRAQEDVQKLQAENRALRLSLEGHNTASYSSSEAPGRHIRSGWIKHQYNHYHHYTQ